MLDGSLRLLLRRLGLVFLFYTLLRALFLAFNYTSFSEASVGQIAYSFVYGLRFDAASVVMVNGGFILLSLFPHGNVWHPSYQRVLRWIFVASNAPFFALSLVDMEFFKFIGRRSGNEIFTITGDIMNQIGQLAGYYWYIGLGFAALIILLAKMFPKAPAIPEKDPMYWQRYLRLIGMAAFVVLGIRGGFQLKPIRPAHAFVHEHTALGHLTLNTPFTFIKSIGKTKLEEKHYFGSDEEMLALLPFDTPNQELPNRLPNRENVVLIILESFSSEYVGALNDGEGYTPFLDSLATEGLLFRNNFANGRKSIEALPSIISGLPSLLEEPFITSPYQANTVYGIGNVLQQEGYTSAFFHGAINGSMGFNQYTHMAGIERYYGLDEYPAELTERDYDGTWGIFDEPYLQYVADELNTFPQPFFGTLFTLSSHQPYAIPEQYKDTFPRGELEIHESIGYTDHALRAFFRTASQQPWFSNTLFVIVADHTQMSVRPEYQHESGYYRVPLVLYHPGKKLKADEHKVTQHADILPTLVDYLQLPAGRLLPFGQSVLDSSSPGFALFYNGVSYFMVLQNGMVELTADNQVQYHSYNGETPDYTLQGLQLKAFVQYFRNKMVANDLYLWARSGE